ncbi:MAG: acyl-ACP--UDP-N-acetylglucosamine O-acyltransferase [Polyangiaceae bacterium]
MKKSRPRLRELSSGEATVHPTAVVDPRAHLEAGVEIGPYCVVGPEVHLGAGTVLVSHVVVHGKTRLGRGVSVHPFVSVGGPPQVRPRGGGEGELAEGTLVVGDGVVVRENVTLHVGTGGGETVVGEGSLLMASSHVGHDARVGRHVVVANGVQLAGHVTIEDHVTFGGLAGVAQHVRVGESAFVAAGAMCEVDVPPFVIVQGDRARVRALNKVGLRRRGVSDTSIEALERVFRALFVRADGTRKARLEALAPEADPLARALVAWVAART